MKQSYPSVNPSPHKTRLFFLLLMQLILGLGLGLLPVREARAQLSSITLLTEPGSTRAVAYNTLTHLREPFTPTTASLLSTDNATRVTLFAVNFDLMAGDPLSVLKVEAEDSAHNKYVLPVERIDRVPTHQWLSGIVVKLPGTLGNVGDVIVRLSYQGVSSNRVRLAIGSVGGGLPDAEVGAIPVPAPATEPAVKPAPTPETFVSPALAAGPDAVRFLEQATFGPTKADLAKVRQMGYKAWLDEQFSLPLPTYGPELTTLVPTDSSATNGCPTGAAASCFNEKYTTLPLQRRFYANALYGQDQLRQRVSFALSQIFVVSGRDITVTSWLTPYLQALDRNAFGNFRQLLKDITLNPAMGNYLDMAGNNKGNPNENYAREILQLFSIGLDELNIDGTPVVDAQGNRVATYDQTTITNFARVFTGWNIPAVTGQTGVLDYVNPMTVRETNHDTNEKILLDGATLPAGQTSNLDLDAALDNIFFHKNVGPFIGKQLIQHLVTSNPSPEYVARVAKVFNNNGAGVRGDLRAVVTAILLDPEARGDSKSDPSYGKMREPVLYVTNVLRAFNVKSFDKTTTSDGYVNPQSAAMDQDVYRAPTVFNYFSPDYAVPGTNLLGPEFGILSTSTVLKRANFVNTILYAGINKTAPTSSIVSPNGTALDLADNNSINWVTLAGNPADPKPLIDQLDALLLHGTMPSSMRQSITTAVTAIPGTDAASSLKRAQTAIYLVTTSAQYQLEK